MGQNNSLPSEHLEDAPRSTASAVSLSTDWVLVTQDLEEDAARNTKRQDETNDPTPNASGGPIHPSSDEKKGSAATEAEEEAATTTRDKQADVASPDIQFEDIGESADDDMSCSFIEDICLIKAALDLYDACVEELGEHMKLYSAARRKALGLPPQSSNENEHTGEEEAEAEATTNTHEGDQTHAPEDIGEPADDDMSCSLIDDICLIKAALDLYDACVEELVEHMKLYPTARREALGLPPLSGEDVPATTTPAIEDDS